MDIILKDVSKRFGDKLVLNNFSAAIKEHKTTCIMGPSGCGKTTLLNIMMGFVSPDSGTVSSVPKRKSAVFQEDRLCETFNAVSNVHMVCQKEITKELVKNHLLQIGLGDRLNIPVSGLSGGMRRRVAVVRAVLAKSEILFLDEPFKGLDYDTKQMVIEYIKANTKEKTVILVTHDEDEVKKMGGELIRMELIPK